MSIHNLTSLKQGKSPVFWMNDFYAGLVKHTQASPTVAKDMDEFGLVHILPHLAYAHRCICLSKQRDDKDLSDCRGVDILLDFVFDMDRNSTHKVM